MGELPISDVLQYPHPVPPRKGEGTPTANVLRVETKTVSTFVSRNLTHSLHIFALKLG